MNPSPLAQAVSGALKSPVSPRYDAHKEALRRELVRALALVDAGRLGCIIITELQDAAGTSMLSTPTGDRSLLAQTAAHVLRDVMPPALAEPTLT